MCTLKRTLGYMHSVLNVWETLFNKLDIHTQKNDIGLPKDQKSYVLPHMWTLDQGQTQQGGSNHVPCTKLNQNGFKTYP
jgi:hypothetical protein